jgi:hypothetical protein
MSPVYRIGGLLSLHAAKLALLAHRIFVPNVLLGSLVAPDLQAGLLSFAIIVAADLHRRTILKAMNV